ncbi:MAG: PDZ domain-containing protein [Spirosomataceae bacterium]
MHPATQRLFRQISCLFFFLWFVQQTQAQDTRLLRNPAISATHIAFVYGGDIWLANQDGSNVKRLTTYAGVESRPHFSPDGKTLAFSGQYDGNTDVFTVPIEGGEPLRLTWHPSPDMVVGWTPDGTSVLFASGRERVPYQLPDQLWTVSVKGGMPVGFAVPRAVDGKFSPNGKQFVYEEIMPWEDEFRNYRGGQNTPLRLIDLQTMAVEKMPWENSRDICPVWFDNLIYFLSDRDFGMNIWVYDTQTKQLKQVTFFKEFDCKNLEGANGMLIFENGGYLYKLKAGTDKPEKMTITVNGEFPWTRPHWVKVERNIDAISISPTGKRVAISARGEIVTLPAKKGDARNLTNSTGTADRDPAWSPDGKYISWFSDEGGEYQLVLADQFGKDRKKIKLDKPTFYYTPAWSPDSKYISFADADRTLWVVDISSGKATKIVNEGFAHPQHIIYPEWAPDSKWIAYAKRLTSEYAAIFVYSLDQNKSFQITDGMSDCQNPAWDASGKYIYFTASTNYGLNVGWLDMSSYEHPVNRAIYMAVLSKDDPSPLAPESDDETVKIDSTTKSTAAPKALANKKKGKVEEAVKEKNEPKEKSVKIDFEDLQNRIIALPIPEKSYVSLKAGKDGILLYADTKPNQYTMSLSRFVLDKRKSESLAEDLIYFDVSADKSKLAYATSGYQVVITDPAGKPNPAEEAVNMSNIQVKIDPAAEWKQIFREAWRYQRDYFYVRNVHGLDLDWAYKTYAPWIDHVKHRSDLNYVLDILGGETSIGHSFVGGGDYPEVNRVPVGLLGADFVIENNKYKIKKIYTGESWNPTLRAPLSGPGIKVKAGDYLLAVNGISLDASTNLYSLFDQTADKQTTLTVNSKPTLDSAKDVVVVPVRNDGMLRQYDWVESNRRLVDKLSNGQLAYVWLPNTAEEGYRNFNRYYFAQKNKKGAIIDERFNQGGSIADYIVDLLSRDLMGYFNNPIGDKQAFTAPNGGIWGPKVMIINEMAGSGGDMLPYMFKKKKIGPLVGTKTWGGLVGIWDVPSLIDGGGITAPRGGFYNTNGDWDVENVGVSPDVLIEQTPKLVSEGHDPQLEKAVEVALGLLKTQSIQLKPQPADPVRVIRPKK